MSASQPTTWPGQVIHVNEDGRVLINRGGRHGVGPGMQLLVVGDGIRDLRDLSVAPATGAAPVLRIRRTYELLEVIYAEDECAVAIAARAPAERRPTVYRGPGGELLVWTPLPPSYTYQLPSADADNAADSDDGGDVADEATDEAGDIADDTADDEDEATEEDGEDTAADDDADTPPQLGEQEDKRWEEAMPLNGTAVGDLVVPAIPAVGSASAG